jgi:flagellar assembly protein FliH
LYNVYRNNYVVQGEQVHRVINTNDQVAAKMQAIMNAQSQAKRQEQLAKAAEEGEGTLGDFTAGIMAHEVELEPLEDIDYGAQAREEASQIIDEANAQAVRIRDHAAKEAETMKELAKKDGYDQGYEEGRTKAAEEAEAKSQELTALENDLQNRYAQAMEELEPKLVDTILTVFDEVFRMQFSGKKELLLALVQNALRGVRETKQYKIRVCEEEVSFLRAHKDELQEQVGDEMTIEIVMDPELAKSQCIIEADSGVYDCSLDAELDNLTRDLKSLSVNHA